MKIRYTSLLFAALLVASCEKEIKFNRSEAEPLIVLNGVLMADSAISVQVSKTRFFLENARKFTDIDNAEVTLTSGANIERLKYSGNGVYTAAHIPRAGEKFELKVTASGLPPVSTSAAIPAHPQVGEVTTDHTFSESPLQLWSSGSMIEAGTSVYSDVKFKIPLTDMREEQNYYRLVVLKMEHYADHIQQTYLSDFSDAVFQSETPEAVMGMTEQNNRYNIFSDVRFNGTTYQLTFTDRVLREIKLLPQYEEYYSQSNVPLRVVYHIEVQQLSHDYFLYLRTRDAYSGSEDIPFMEPVQIFSNIENGTGILGSATISRKSIEVVF